MPLSKVPSYFYKGDKYAFPEKVCAELKKQFPHITDEIMATLATRIDSYRDMDAMFDEFVPEHASAADDGKTGQELRAILSATESLLNLIQAANSRTEYLIEQAYTNHPNAPGGISDKRYPDLNDVQIVLRCFADSFWRSCDIANLLPSGKGRRRGGADDAPFQILDLLNEIMCRIYQTNGTGKHILDGTGKRIRQNNENLGPTDMLALIKILKIEIAESYVKRWRKRVTG